jgi:LPS sulfotransferase NodH
MASEKAIKIIHLKRQNKFRSIVSKLIAMKTQQWEKIDSRSQDQESATVRTVEIPEVFLDQELTRITSWEKSGDEYFADHPKISVFYEDLVASPASEFRTLTDFLGVEYCEPKTQYQKQNPQPLSELVENYDDLKRRFEGTQWEGYFT